MLGQSPVGLGQMHFLNTTPPAVPQTTPTATPPHTLNATANQIVEQQLHEVADLLNNLQPISDFTQTQRLESGGG